MKNIIKSLIFINSHTRANTGECDTDNIEEIEVKGSIHPVCVCRRYSIIRSRFTRKNFEGHFNIEVSCWKTPKIVNFEVKTKIFGLETSFCDVPPLKSVLLSIELIIFMPDIHVYIRHLFYVFTYINTHTYTHTKLFMQEFLYITHIIGVLRHKRQHIWSI